MTAAGPLLTGRYMEAMVCLAGEVPTGLKVRRVVTKWVLKEAARRYLPDAIIDRRRVSLGGFRRFLQDDL